MFSRDSRALLRHKLKSHDLCGPRTLGAAVAFLCLVLGCVPCADAVPADPPSWSTASALLTSGFAIADFDGDTRPDIATVEIGRNSASESCYWIAFRLSSGPGQTLGITGPTGGIRIASRDVNGDDFPDVVVTTAWTNQPVAVLLNDGRGNFTASKPSEFRGAFSTSQGSLGSTTYEINDTFAVLLSRELLGEGGQRHEVSVFQAPARLPVPQPSAGWLFYAVDSFHHRAPPLRTPAF